MLVDHRLPLNFQPQLSTFLGLSGYVGEPVVNCSIMGESCFTEAQFGGFGCPAMGCWQHNIDIRNIWIFWDILVERPWLVSSFHVDSANSFKLIQLIQPRS